MARSINDIIVDIDAQIASNIPALNSPSLVAVWRLIRYVVALAIYTHETLWDIHKLELEEIASATISGTARWYADMVLKWQYGFPMTFNPGTYKYYYNDTTSAGAIASRIVKHVAAIENSGGLVLKVAGDNSGVLSQLAPAEVIALETYIDRIKFAGARTSVISLPPDKIRFKADVYYDGVLALTDFKTQFEPAFEAYLRAIYFNGSYNTNEHIDALQNVAGFKDILFNNIEASFVIGTWLPVVRSYAPVSGYFTMVAIGTTPADTLINYIPTV